MNPGDVAQSVLPLTSSDLSLFALFWQAHWLVKSVMIGLLVCSVWVWAIALDKTFLFGRMRRAMDGFEQAFWVLGAIALLAVPAVFALIRRDEPTSAVAPNTIGEPQPAIAGTK